MDRSSFLASEEKQDAVTRNIEIIGEAAQSIRRRHSDFAARHPEIPWGGVYGMRNAIAHGSFARALRERFRADHHAVASGGRLFSNGVALMMTLCQRFAEFRGPTDCSSSASIATNPSMCMCSGSVGCASTGWIPLC
ncbi:MAG: HepT-like ribonuclease domain-containing protein [Burkholderiales bacterium]